MKKTKIRIHPIKGRGVYADEPVKSGEVIEVCQLIILDFKEVGPFLEGYVFDFDPKHVGLALGNGSLYNHNDVPNAIAYMDDEKRLLTFEALKPIKKGDEILIDYGYSEAERKKFKLV